MSKVLRTHSTFHTDPWRRMIRTLTFVYVTSRSSNVERRAIISWLRNLHRPIALFKFDINCIVFATFAYGLVKAHETLGHITEKDADAVVRGIMSMANKLNPEDADKHVPDSLAEVEDYLAKTLSCRSEDLIKINNESLALLSVTRLLREQGLGMVFRSPLVCARLLGYNMLARALSTRVLLQELSDGQRQEGFFWGCVRRVQWFLQRFHYSICPRSLTFHGTLELFALAHPRLQNVVEETYTEIFGRNGISFKDKFSTVEDHLPKTKLDRRLSPTTPHFAHELTELLKCYYYQHRLTQISDGLPRHLGVIMDGNRRYSREKGFRSTHYGHQAGARKLLQLIPWALNSGIHNLTVWALSDDNVNRDREELDHIFSTMADFITDIFLGDSPFLIPGIRFRVIGDRSIIPEFLRLIILKAESATAANTDLNFQVAIGYGGRSEITRAVKLAVKHKISTKNLPLKDAIEEMSESDISSQIYSSQLELPAVDAILRTSGEARLSGFALWESQYAEFSIISDYWPSLKESVFLKHLLDLSTRKRRFGK
ncbi:hypothetical protein NQ176_g2908 [Zarea fungicola]|uniref:Uncharacterized protein n=1 Tax=Zarea fungicola TaxID=93591 RepID=A0ACC1NLR3_9HYPO|nr:hypothetical protein NQ176_g2908 [Lecanicillium fungicola]